MSFVFKLVLFQPEIAANLGACIRNAACFGAELHVIEPCGFPWKAKDIDRVALDYGEAAQPVRHASWSAFDGAITGRRVLLTTKAQAPIWAPRYRPGDCFILGQESAGAPDWLHDGADLRVTIPLAPGARSLNMATAGAVALAEARRQAAYDE